MTLSKALDVVNRIQRMCDFFDNSVIKKAIEDAVPLTNMNRGPGSFGFEIPLWVGLGVVGLWAALDAFADREELPKAKCPICDRASCVHNRFARHAKGSETSALAELEDLRHLYAHNYVGEADNGYFRTAAGSTRKRHVLALGQSCHLTVGGSFDGHRAQLDLNQLRAYAQTARSVLERFS